VKKALGPKAFLDTLSTLTRQLRGVLIEMYADSGVGSAQARFVRHVSRSGRISQAELARATDTDPALTGRALQALLDRGVLKRERSAVDRREYLVELGPNGAEVLAQVNEVRDRLAERLVRPLDARDRSDFDRIAKKILAAFAEEDAVSSGRPR
jgi:DNA-binding MarR family transcriptional regulator